ncbi:MAG TPA: class I adenylate cyclase, partial [Gammaproteobacteria bacterium]|nr:class I adenylate cyclase [Gammaproteobacteria bacterium]
MLDVNAIKKRFLRINADRLTRTRECLRSRQRDVLDVLPLLFHSNHPSFPGYVSKTVPMGISDYAPSQRTLEAGKRLVRSFEHKNRALLQYDIHAMFLMGSSGTIAYSSDSDFDIWLCHRPELTTLQLAELQQKATLIERWAATLDLEVHFFLMNAEAFRQGQDTALSVESSGSAQHHLLLEEFYRTGLLLAGRYPVWWLVPPEQEGEYDRYVEHLRQRRLIKENETIDFGGLPRAPAEEFFGAALWQLYKGIDSPYKATLKLMLMEVYADEYPGVDLLSQRFKRAVHEGSADLAGLDPYIMLYRKLEEYLRTHDKDDYRLALMRRCFYFKVNEALSKPVNLRHESWRREIMREFARDWQWDDDYLAFLDSRPGWKIHQVMEERKSLVNALTLSYHALSRFARTHSQLAKISQQDLTILGRKLYAAFERKAGKIDIVNRGISDNVWESQVSIHVTGSDHEQSWTLFRGMASEPDHDERPLKRARTLVELLAWCHLNQVVDERTAILLYGRNVPVDVSEIKAIIKCLQQCFPGGTLPPSDMNDFVQSACLKQGILFVNVGARGRTLGGHDGKFLTSNKVDAFSFGGICQNLVLSLDMIALTSWQEVLTQRYEGEEGIIECLQNYLRWTPPGAGEPPPLQVHCFSAGRGATIARRVEELLQDIVKCFYGGEHGRNSRYVFMIEHKYHVLSMRDGLLHQRQAASYQELLQLLGKPQPRYSPVVMDRYASANNLLSVIFANDKPDVVQFYFQREGASIDLYIVDERGALFHQHRNQGNLALTLNHYTRFLQAVLRRQYLGEGGSGESPPPIEYYQVVKNSSGQWYLASEKLELDEPPLYSTVQVIGQEGQEGRPSYTIFCDEVEFSSLEHGKALFHAVARHVLNQRNSGQRYPIYITDVDLAPGLLGMERREELQTVVYLNY